MQLGSIAPPYPFWQNYIHRHSDPHQTMSINPAALYGVVMCLLLLGCWSAYQAKARCRSCGSWPIRCRCSHDVSRRG